MWNRSWMLSCSLTESHDRKWQVCPDVHLPASFLCYTLTSELRCSAGCRVDVGTGRPHAAIVTAVMASPRLLILMFSEWGHVKISPLQAVKVCTTGWRLPQQQGCRLDPWLQQTFPCRWTDGLSPGSPPSEGRQVRLAPHLRSDPQKPLQVTRPHLPHPWNLEADSGPLRLTSHDFYLIPSSGETSQIQIRHRKHIGYCPAGANDPNIELGFSISPAQHIWTAVCFILSEWLKTQSTTTPRSLKALRPLASLALFVCLLVDQYIQATTGGPEGEGAFHWTEHKAPSA